MAQEAEKNQSTGSETETEMGVIRIADDVVAGIATYAAREVEGLHEITPTGSSRFLSGKNNASRGCRVEVDGDKVKVDLSVIIDYGYNIPATSSAIQTKVSNAIENMTGLTVTDVNVRIAGIKMPEQEK